MTNMTSRKHDAQKAADLGRAAHVSGAKRVPGWDAELMALVKAAPESNRCALMAAWLRAYDAQVIAALASA